MPSDGLFEQSWLPNSADFYLAYTNNQLDFSKCLKFLATDEEHKMNLTNSKSAAKRLSYLKLLLQNPSKN